MAPAPAPAEIPPLRRDGTSQAARASAALDPAGLGIEERGTRELLALARAHAAQLLYYDAENRPAGRWDGFLDGLRDEDILAFLERPEDFPEAAYPALRRPHLVLFLVWLRLLGLSRDALNGLTARHLDFHLQEVLRLAPHPAEPDRAFLLLSPAAGLRAVEVPAGTE